MIGLYNYKIVSVNKVLDGDTVDVTIDLGFQLLSSMRIRMAGYDAPETFRPSNKEEAAAGKLVTTYLEGLLKANAGNLYLKSYKLDIYGRYSGDILIKVGEEYKAINAMVVEYMTTNHLTKSQST